MTGILLWAGLSSLAFLLFFGLAIMGILQKRPGRMVGAVVSLLVALGAGVGAVVSLYAQETLPAPSGSTARDGERMYNDMLGAPVVKCVTVSHHRDRIAPAYEEFESVRAFVCPIEIRRIVQGQGGEWELVPSTAASRPSNNEGAVGEFTPAVLGDTILVRAGMLVNGRALRWIYCALDSSAIVVVDQYQ